MIQAERAYYPVAAFCRVLEVKRSGFYAFLRRQESKRSQQTRVLRVHIRDAYVANWRTYGSPRIHAELVDRGFQVGRNRIARLMRLDGLEARCRRRFVVTTQSDPGLPVAANVLNRQFSQARPNQTWVADLTYIWTRQGWLFLAVVLDLFSRRVVGWATSNRMDRELVRTALAMAVERRHPSSGLIHHSDRGCQYASWDYQRALLERSIVCSMSRKGNCYDNAVVESFFSTLKIELVYRMVFADRDQARSALFDYIEMFYNAQRRHSALGYLSPAEFERRWSRRQLRS
jgi:transposase InsO family protein